MLLLLILALIGFLSFQRLYMLPWNGDDNTLGDEQASLLTPPNLAYIMKQERHRKMHLCHFRPHNYRPAQMLINDFGFEKVDASKIDDCDMIFGGYPHCGSKPWDWNMKTGLNAELKAKGWNTLKPHQVWFPCMGCSQSYCNKRELCWHQHEQDQNSCFLLPDHLDKLSKQMKSDSSKLWVLKRDAPDLHLHRGTGVQIISSPDELPNSNDLKDLTRLVQPYMDPLLGKGVYVHKSEVKFYVATTSITPLRVYVYSRQFVTMSPTLYDSKNSSELHKKCMHDSHGLIKKCATEQDYLRDDDLKFLNSLAEPALLSLCWRLSQLKLLKCSPRYSNAPILFCNDMR